LASHPITRDVIKTVAPTISNPIVASFHWLGDMSAIDILLFSKVLRFFCFLYIGMALAMTMPLAYLYMISVSDIFNIKNMDTYVMVFLIIVIY